MKSRIIFSLLSPGKIQSLPNGSLNLSSKSKIHTPNATFTHTFSTASGASKNLINLRKSDDSEKGSFRNAMEMMVEVILRNRRIPFGYNSYLNEVNKVPSLLSKKTSTSTSTFIKSQKIKYDYQSADLIAQDISFQLRNKTRSFRSIFTQIVKNIPAEMKKGVEGIRVSCSGRLKGAEIARTECAKYGKTSVNTINQKIDYATAEVSTRYGVSGVKVWISYRGGRGLSGVNGGSTRGFSTFLARGRSGQEPRGDNGDSYLNETRVDQYSVSPLLMKALQDAGYEKMTVVQEATLPVILKGQDVLAKARTGTGKTGCSLTV